jgi:hypothetical protein
MISANTSLIPAPSFLAVASSSRRPRVTRNMMPRNPCTRSASISTTESSAAAASSCAISGADSSSNIVCHNVVAQVEFGSKT